MTIPRAILAAGFSLLLITAAATPPLPPVSAFVAQPQYRFLSLSPDGRKLATVTNHDFVDHVALVDLDTMRPSLAVSFDDAEPLAMWWKGNDRLLFLVRNYHGDIFFRAYNLASQRVEHLINFNRLALRILNPLPDDPDNILVSSLTNTGVSLQLFNVSTGKSTVTEKNPGHVQEWFADRNGRALAGFGLLNKEWFLLSRTAPTAPWVKIPLGDGPWPDFMPVAVHDDQSRLLGWDLTTADTIRLVLRDPVTGESEVLFHSPEADPLSLRLRANDNPSRLRFLVHETDRLTRKYFSPLDEKLAAQIDLALPDRVNDIISASADETKLLIRSDHVHGTGRYWLLNRQAGKLVPLGHAQKELSDVSLTPGERFVFTSRDGLRLIGRIYRPADAPSPPPTIVYVAPELSSRSYPMFHFAVQLLANRGYAVLQIDHRGVEGYGRKTAALGEQTINTAMADDLADGVAHAIQEKWIDPKRVAIHGNGVGGLLAVYALARNPGSFSTWININTPMQRDEYTDTEPTLAHLIRERNMPPSGNLGRQVERVRLTTTVIMYIDQNVSAIKEGPYVGKTWETPVLENSEWRSPPTGDVQRLKLRNSAALLDASDLLSQIKVPSFHFYESSNLIDRGGGKVRRILERSGVTHVFKTGIPTDKIGITVRERAQQAHDENLRLYTAMLDFLDRHLGAATPR